MLRFSVPEEKTVSRPRREALWDFADQALGLLFHSIRSMGFPTEDVVVSAMGGADLVGRTFGRGRQLALAVQKSLRRHSVVLNGSDLGGTQSRIIWLESASGRLIVRSKSPGPLPIGDTQSLRETHGIRLLSRLRHPTNQFSL